MNIVIAILAVIVAVMIGSASAQAASCVAGLPLPSAPSANAQSVTYPVQWTPVDQMSFTLWREPCGADPTQSFLYLRATPTAGAPYLCSGSLVVIDSGSQYDVFLLRDPGNIFSDDTCGTLFVPSTFFLAPTGQPAFDNNHAITLIYQTIFASWSGSLPAYIPNGGPGVVPVVGLWWNPNEDGSGYNFDVKHGVLVATIYSYKMTGEPLWYITSGPIVNGTFTGTLNKAFGGQCISCSYNGFPALAGNDGVVTINFSSPTSATMYLPGGRITNIQPQAF